jgi:hypothetical protein
MCDQLCIVLAKSKPNTVSYVKAKRNNKYKFILCMHIFLLLYTLILITLSLFALVTCLNTAVLYNSCRLCLLCAHAATDSSDLYHMLDIPFPVLMSHIYFSSYSWVWPFSLATCTNVPTQNVQRCKHLAEHFALNASHGKTTEMAYLAHFGVYQKCQKARSYQNWKIWAPSFLTFCYLSGIE